MIIVMTKWNHGYEGQSKIHVDSWAGSGGEEYRGQDLRDATVNIL